VRHLAIDTLSIQSTLSENILQAIVARLEDSDRDVRHLAIETLGKQSTLSENILQAIVAQLKHSDRDVRQSAINALGKQSTLSENILQAIMARLSKGTFDGSSEVVGMLLKQDNLYNRFLNFDVKTLRSLYKTLVQQSFRQQLSCYRQDGNLYFDMPDRQKMISLVLNKDDILGAFRQKTSLVLNKNAFLDAFSDEALTLKRPTASADDLNFALTHWLALD
jgi:hypothetical protein